MDMRAFSNVAWKKSTRSGGLGECVEVATADEVVAMRDSKDITGPMLVIPHDSWEAFLDAVKDSEFDLR